MSDIRLNDILDELKTLVDNNDYGITLNWCVQYHLTADDIINLYSNVCYYDIKLIAQVWIKIAEKIRTKEIQSYMQVNSAVSLFVKLVYDTRVMSQNSKSTAELCQELLDVL